jgi:hypothetical protein
LPLGIRQRAGSGSGMRNRDDWLRLPSFAAEDHM